MIVGAAGHIDHGKTALIKALTGFDGDRLKEEKARGITIDLGFAYLATEPGEVIGFVDVPGHERFVHTMVAGSSGIDFVLLAVAADDGVKPQTLEHLAIVDLLGVKDGVVAITKTDLSTPERLTEVKLQIANATAKTSLKDVDILPVSSLTGQGVDRLRTHLVAAAKQIPARSAEGRFRLAVDRVFTLSGVGLVVTGAALSGQIQVGGRVVISPRGLTARVRSLHAQNRPAEIGQAGDRCALSLVGPDISKDTIRRGDVVLDVGLHAPTDRIDAELHVLPSERRPIGQWFPVRLHHSGTEVGARIALLDDAPVKPGAWANVQLALERPIAAAALDRFVVRDVSAKRTLGGGQFVDLRALARHRRSPERRAQRAALAIADPFEALASLLNAIPFTADLVIFARDRALGDSQIGRLIAELNLVLVEYGAARMAFLPDRWRMLAASLKDFVAAFHAANPDLQGVGRDHLRALSQSALSKATFIAALQKMARDGDLVLEGGFVRLASHYARLTPSDEAAWGAIAQRLGGEERFRPPRVRDIAGATGETEQGVRRLFKLAARMGMVDEVAHDHFFLRRTVDEMAAIAGELATREGAFTAAQFRDRLGNGRKVAIQILDFFDRHRVTLRRGDLRRVNRERLDLFGLPMLSSMDPTGGESSLVRRPDFKSG